MEDGCATITKFTAYLISEGLRIISDQDNLLRMNILCGGGRKKYSLKKIFENPFYQR